MNNRTYYIFILLTVAVLSSGLQGCKKFLNVDPVDAMSGNNFWKTRSDVEQFTDGIYKNLRASTCGNGNVLLGIGDWRNTAWKTKLMATQLSYIKYLNNNDIRNFYLMGDPTNMAYYPGFGAQNIADWGNLYVVIAAANTMLDKMNTADIAGLSEADKNAYRAEAIFIRSMVYFIMVRHWGDVPYITDINDKEPKERMNQLEVLRNCITDLKANLDHLPWSYADRGKKGVRAMRGAALALIMEMNMWMACFDTPNERNYYQEVVANGNKLINENGGVYKLLPIDNWKEIFKGNSDESLFEITQNYNYKEVFSTYALVANLVLRTPYKTDVSKSVAFYDSVYLRQLYDPQFNGTPDRRRDNWFEETYLYDNTNNNFVFLKYLNMYTNPSGIDYSNDSKMIFRYADAFLLRAEANQKLGNDALAVEDINQIRRRAMAEEFTLISPGVVDTETGDPIGLADGIWWERERELMGEGKMFYDLVRTKRIMSSLYTPNPMLFEDFSRGAWTYPIKKSVRDKNPKIKQNEFWSSIN